MKRIFACLFILAFLPSMSSQPAPHAPTSDRPFGTVALAGHSSASGRSECTCPVGPDGICPCCGYKTTFICTQNDVDGVSPVHADPSVESDPASESNTEPGSLLILLMLVALARAVA